MTPLPIPNVPSSSRSLPVIHTTCCDVLDLIGEEPTEHVRKVFIPDKVIRTLDLGHEHINIKCVRTRDVC